jgi:hypothetical protein
MNTIVRSSVVHVFILALVLGLSLTACSPKDEGAAQDAERQARLDELAQQQQDVQAARDELAGLKERLLQAQAGSLPEGEAADATELATRIEQKDAQITTMAEDLNQALVDFINADPPVEGEPIDPLVQRAFALKADEDIALAEEYITEGGDYARAVGIYEDILAFDPSNAGAQQALAEAQDMRYMTEERFAQVKKDMTQGEVEKVLGPANLRNRRQYPQDNASAWYYPKNEAGDAAAVWFRKKGDAWIVYKVDFNAVAAAKDEPSA